MPSTAWRVLGTADILGHLKADLKRASSCVWIIGPWIDGFFAKFATTALPEAVDVRIITRPLSGASPSFSAHALAALDIFATRPKTSIRYLDNLHAKVIATEDEFVYCGSANWYRYSLQDSRELVVRGPAQSAIGLLEEMYVLWEAAVAAAPVEHLPQNQKVAQGYRAEVVDPIAEAKLREVPGSFVISRTKQR